MFQDDVQRWFFIRKHVQDEDTLEVQLIRAPFEGPAKHKKGGAFLHRLFTCCINGRFGNYRPSRAALPKTRYCSLPTKPNLEMPLRFTETRALSTVSYGAVGAGWN